MTTAIQLVVDRVLDPGDFHVYLHPSKMAALSITDGSIVRIRSRARKTILANAVTGDSNIPVSTIKISRCLRINLSAYLGQIVIVDSFTKCVPADSVTLAPIDDTVTGLSGNFQEIFTANLTSLPMTPNFVIPVFTLHRVIEFKVISCAPANFVVVRNRETIIVKNQTVKRAEDVQRFDSICYDDIGGIEPQLRDLRADIELPLLQPFIFDTFGIHPFRGILLSAPSGCGKTMLCRAIQNETPLHFEKIPGFDLLARSAEEASCIMRKLADRAIAKAPSIVFVEDLDLIIEDQFVNGVVDKRLYLAFIAALDMMLSRPNIAVIGATRDSSLIPAPLKNVNRFGHIIEITPPGREKKMEILRKITRGMKVDSDTLERFAEESKTGGDLEIRVYEELMTKAFELAGNHPADNEPLPLSEIAGLEFGAAIPPSRDEESYQRDSFSNNNNISNNQAQGFGFSPFQMNQSANSNNNNSSSSKQQKKLGSGDPFGSNSSKQTGIDPFSTTQPKILSSDPFSSGINNNTNTNSNTNNNTSAASNSNPFSIGAGSDPFATTPAQRIGNNDPFNSGANQQQISDPFGKPNKMSADPFSATSDPFSQSGKGAADQSAAGNQQQQQQQKSSGGKKKASGKIDPFAPRSKK